MEVQFTELLQKSFKSNSSLEVLFWISRNLNLKRAYNPLQDISLTKLKDALIRLSSSEISNEKKSKEEVSLVNDIIKSIVNEMACNYNQSLIRVLGFLFTKILQKQFSGLHITEPSLLKIKHQLGRAPVIFLPSHRSYCDFILMAYICFSYEISLPCVAAGIDFKTMKIIGSLLSYCKAFFIRRSFIFDEFYKKIFNRYIHLLITFGNSPVEFFIEGTRSRTGKPLTPKFGLLKNIIETYLCGDVPDLIFVPVTLSYDRVLEDVLFSYEVLGVPKPKESTSGFIKAVNMLDERYGNVFVNFGGPISLREYTRMKQLSTKNKADCVTVIEDLAFDIVTRQQELQTITTINLLCLVLNESYVISGYVCADFSVIIEKMRQLISYVEKFGAVVYIPSDLEEAVCNCLEIHKSFIVLNENYQINLVPSFYVPSHSEKQLKGTKISPDIMKSAVPVLKMNLYIGSLMHYLWIPSTILLLIRHFKNISQDKLISEFLFLNNIFSVEFSYGQNAQLESFEKTLEILRTDSIVVNEGSNLKLTDNYDPMCITLVCTIYPAIITYECTFNLLCKDPLLKKPYSLILRESQNLVQERIVRKYHYHHASLSLDSVSLAVESLIKIGALSKNVVDGTTVITVTDTTFLKEAHNKFSSFLTHFECHWIKKHNFSNAALPGKL